MSCAEDTFCGSKSQTKASHVKQCYDRLAILYFAKTYHLQDTRQRFCPYVNELVHFVFVFPDRDSGRPEQVNLFIGESWRRVDRGQPLHSFRDSTGLFLEFAMGAG